MKLRFALALVLAASAVSLEAAAQQRGRGNLGYSGITVYEHPDFRGDSVTFRNEVPDLRQHALNDRISSIEVDGNQAWEVCRDVNYGGGCRVFQGSIDDLRSEGWNDRISSMRAVGFARGNVNRDRGVFGNRRGNANVRQSRLVFYDRTNFRGDARNVLNSAGNLGAMGDRVRSVEVYGGTWELCDGSSRNARCVTVTESIPDLRNLGFRNGVTSAREVNSARSNNRNWNW
ncbi:MAG TPA: beta/gamma crystallin-related protein [Vicinamibacterales bacterium]|nr:beta/gamma crystallin-related protein [Vicinamibacterales bacterium]